MMSGRYPRRPRPLMSLQKPATIRGVARHLQNASGEANSFVSVGSWRPFLHCHREEGPCARANAWSGNGTGASNKHHSGRFEHLEVHVRKGLVLIGLALLLAAAAIAQEIPASELFLGYSFVRVNPGNGVNAFNSNGGLGQFQYNVNRHVGVLAEFGGQVNGNISARATNFPGDQTQFLYLFGPRISSNKTGKFTPFVEFEFGGVHNSRSFTVPNSIIPAGFTVPSGVTVEPGIPNTKFRSTQNAFAMAFGGGLDIKVGRRFAVRPIELDYLGTHFSPFNFSQNGAGVLIANINNNTQWQNNLRYAAGVDFHFGQKGR
jgi:outer membrane immunogenic protein